MIVQGTLASVARSRSTGTVGLASSRVSPLRSPLRYPGGKSRAVKSILEYFPTDLDALASPFLGGGSVELACVARGVDVYGYDAFHPLVNFWQMSLENAKAVAARASSKYYPLSHSAFYALQKRFFNMSDLCDPIERAAIFFALNRSSYSGTTLSGGMSPGHPRFTESAIERLANFKADSLTVETADFKDSLARHAGEFLYLDPPYANGGKLYGARGDLHDGFDHEGLARILNGRDGWVLSYNDCERVRDLYPEHKFVQPEWTYGMNNNVRASNEILILSRDLVNAA